MKKYLALTLFFLPSLAFASFNCTLQSEGSVDYGAVGYGATQSLMQGQPFTVSAACSPTTISVKAEKNGSPADNFIISIYSDGSGSPSSLLKSADGISGGLLSTSFGTVTGTFSGSPITLNTGTTYWAVLSRSGSASPTDRYTVSFDIFAGNPQGQGQRLDATWVSNDGFVYSYLDIEGDTPSSTPPPPPFTWGSTGAALDAPPTVFALSALSISLLAIGVYFAIFWMIMLIMFWPVTIIWRAVAAFLNPPFYD